MHTSIEHLASCPTCRRRTLHRHVVVLDDVGDVVSDERLCIPCADGGLRSKTSALKLQRPPRAPGRKPARKRRASEDVEEQQVGEEQSQPARWRKRTGAA